MLLKLAPGSGFVKVLRNCHLYKLYKVKFSFIVVVFFAIANQNRRRRRAGGAALEAGPVSWDQPDSPDR